MTGILTPPQTAIWRGKPIRVTKPSEVTNLNGLIRVFKTYGNDLEIYSLDSQTMYAVEDVKTLHAIVYPTKTEAEPKDLAFVKFVFGAASEWTFSVEGSILYGTRVVLDDSNIERKTYRFTI
jgi:hypothetical protein